MLLQTPLYHRKLSHSNNFRNSFAEIYYIMKMSYFSYDFNELFLKCVLIINNMNLECFLFINSIMKSRIMDIQFEGSNATIKYLPNDIYIYLYI